jgi:tetratricopeptide (TPR) repeat protein
MQLEPRAGRMLDAIDGSLTMRDVLDRAGFSRPDAAILLYALANTGLIRVRGEPDGSAEDVETADEITEPPVARPPPIPVAPPPIPPKLPSKPPPLRAAIHKEDTEIDVLGKRDAPEEDPALAAIVAARARARAAAEEALRSAEEALRRFERDHTSGGSSRRKSVRPQDTDKTPIEELEAEAPPAPASEGGEAEALAASAGVPEVPPPETAAEEPEPATQVASETTDSGFTPEVSREITDHGAGQAVAAEAPEVGANAEEGPRDEAAAETSDGVRLAPGADAAAEDAAEVDRPEQSSGLAQREDAEPTGAGGEDAAGEPATLEDQTAAEAPPAVEAAGTEAAPDFQPEAPRAPESGDALPSLPAIQPAAKPAATAPLPSLRETTAAAQIKTAPKSIAKAAGRGTAPRLDLALDRARARRDLEEQRARLERKNYYERLGVHRGAAKGDLRRAYERLRREHDPDHVLSGMATREARLIAEEIVLLIRRAFEALSDDEERRTYDRQLGGADGENGHARVLVAEAAFRRGADHAERGEWAQALEEFQAAVELNSDEAAYLAHQAWASFCAHPDDDAVARRALADLHLAVDRSPKLEDALVFRGLIQEKLGLREDAIGSLRAAADANPDSVRALRALRAIEPAPEKRSGFLRNLGL